jgi:CelD/BcsL family acetyltransferase involved in cellulose biosynthesis
VRAVEGFAGLSANERLEWNALFENQSDPVPFQSLAWNEAWWKAFGQSSSRSISNDAVILVLSRHGEIIAFFPMFRVTFSMLGIPLLRHVKPMGSDPNLTEVKTGIVREGRERAAYAAVADYFKDADRGWELLNFPAVPGGLLDARDALSIEHPTAPVIEGFTIALADDWDAFHRGLKRNVKEAIRRCHNRPKRDGLKPVFSCLSDSAAIRAMLPEFYRLHSARAEKPDSVHHPEYFQDEKSRSFIDLLASDPENSGIRLFALKDGDRLIAARLAFETPGGTYLYYSGYDLEYGKYGIMTRLVVEVLKRSIACGQQYVHLSFGRDRSKTQWSPREMVYKQQLIVRNSVRGRLLAVFYLAFQKRWKKTHRLPKASQSRRPSAFAVSCIRSLGILAKELSRGRRVAG